MTTGPSGSWRRVSLPIVLAVHERQITEHGGVDGIRDQGAVESALARPVHRATYGDPDVAELAACHLFGLARNHGFADGNKRTAWVVSRLFLANHGYRLEFDPVEAVRQVESVASGQVSESELAVWFRKRLKE